MFMLHFRSEAQHDRDSLTQKMRMTEEHKVKYASKMKQKISELKEQFTKNSIAVCLSEKKKSIVHFDSCMEI